jgi:hypothetical protein
MLDSHLKYIAEKFVKAIWKIPEKWERRGTFSTTKQEHQVRVPGQVPS